MPRFTFDVKLFSTITVQAEDEASARALMREHLEHAEANFGPWTAGPDAGQPILADTSTDGEADLIEIDGEQV